MGSIGALGVLALVWPVLASLGQRRSLLDQAPRSSRRIALTHGAVELASFFLAAALAAALVTVPSGLIGNLGFFPLLRGLGALTSARFVAPAPAPPALGPAGDLPVRAIAQVAGQGLIDRLALWVPLLALATGAEILALAVAFAALTLVATPLLVWLPGGDLWASRADRVRPWTQLILGIAVLITSGSFNWLLHPRG